MLPPAMAACHGGTAAILAAPFPLQLLTAAPGQAGETAQVFVPVTRM